MDQDRVREEAAREKGEALRKDMTEWEQRTVAPTTPFIDRQAARDEEQAETKAATQEPQKLRRGRVGHERDHERER